MRKVTRVLAFATLVALLGCSDTSRSTKSSGPTGSNAPKPAATGPGAINPDNTTITFVGTKKGGRHDGGFKSFSGDIKPIENDITAGTITVEIDTDSLYSDNAKLTNHLKTPDFFEVSTYPKATFVSTAIKVEPKDEATHVITGELTLHGTKKEISFPAKVTTTDDLLTLESTFTFDRTDFGINYSPDRVDKAVTVKVSAKVARK